MILSIVKLTQSAPQIRSLSPVVWSRVSSQITGSDGAWNGTERDVSKHIFGKWKIFIILQLVLFVDMFISARVIAPLACKNWPANSDYWKLCRQ